MQDNNLCYSTTFYGNCFSLGCWRKSVNHWLYSFDFINNKTYFKVSENQNLGQGKIDFKLNTIYPGLHNEFNTHQTPETHPGNYIT